MPPGWTRTGWSRCSPAHCGISMTVAATPRRLAPVTAAAARRARRREWHERHRDLGARAALRADLGGEGCRARGPGRVRRGPRLPQPRGHGHASSPGRRATRLVLDEPLARLDPLARHDFMASLMAAVAEDALSVVLSSHVIADLERVADYLIVLSHGQVQVAGEVEGLLACHSTLTGP